MSDMSSLAPSLGSNHVAATELCSYPTITLGSDNMGLGWAVNAS